MGKNTRRVFHAAIFAAALLIMGQALWAALVVQINGPIYIWVPYQGCANPSWTATANMSVSTYDWTWDSQQVGTSSGYSHYFSSPELEYAYWEDYYLAVYVTGGGYGDGDARYVSAFYEAGNENGPCGEQIVCDP